MTSNEKREESNFSLSFDLSSKVDLLRQDRIEDLVSSILLYRFQNIKEKQKFSVYRDRLAMACPYCGDSHKELFKKRGNLYLDTLFFHCYNCGKHTNFLSLIHDFYKEELPDAEVFYYKTYFASNRRPVNKNDVFSFDLDTERLPSREEIMNRLRLQDARGPAKDYLSSRLQTIDDRFAYDKTSNSVIIFNIERKSQKVLGMQRRYLSSQSKLKYMAYNLSSLYRELNTPEPEDNIDKLNDVSGIYGIFDVDFGQDITVFEGCFDAFLFRNSIAISGVSKSFHTEEKENYRFWFDKDKEGVKKTVERLQKGFRVFLWDRFLRDAGLRLRAEKKLDLNELLMFSKRELVDLPDFEKYFSCNKNDILDI